MCGVELCEGFGGVDGEVELFVGVGVVYGECGVKFVIVGVGECLCDDLYVGLWED